MPLYLGSSLIEKLIVVVEGSAIASLAAVAAFAGGTETMASPVSTSVIDSQVIASFAGGTETMASPISTSVIDAQVTASFAGGAEAMTATISLTVIDDQVAASFGGGAETMAATVSTSVIDAQVAAAFAGGTEAMATTVSTSVVDAQAAAAFAGGTEAMAATISLTIIDDQVAAAFGGGTETMTAAVTAESTVLADLVGAASFAGGAEAMAATVSTSIVDAAVAAAFAGGAEAMAATLLADTVAPPVEGNINLAFALAGGFSTTSVSANVVGIGDIIETLTFDLSSLYSEAVTTALAIDDSHLYILAIDNFVSTGWSAQVARYNRNDYSTMLTSISIPSSGSFPTAMCRHGDHLYLGRVDGGLSRIDITDTTATWEAVVNPPSSVMRSVTGGATDDELFAFSSDANNAQRFTISGATLTEDSTWSSATLSNSLRGGAYDSENDELIAVIDGEAEEVLRLDASDGSLTGAHGFSISPPSSMNNSAQGADYDSSNGSLYVVWSQAVAPRNGTVIVRRYEAYTA